MKLEEQFFKETGIDILDTEISGKTPYLKDGRWCSMERGLAWQKFAKWLKQQIPIREEDAFKSGWYISSQISNNNEANCEIMFKEWEAHR